MTDFNQFQDKCIAKLKEGCPVCGWPVMVLTDEYGGLPDEQIFEAQYRCGARFAVGCNGIEVNDGCPDPSREKADELNEEIMDECDTPEEVPLS